MIEDKYLRVKQVCERTGLSRPTIYNMMKAGTFPIQTTLGERAVAWLESEIVMWMETRKTFEKSGLEAKPGRPPTSSKKKKPALARSSGLPAVAVPTPPVNLIATASELDDWGQDEPNLNEAEMNEIRSRHLVLSRKNHPIRK